MLTTIGHLRDRIELEPLRLISDLQRQTGRYGQDEARAWERSLPKLSHAFQSSSFQPLHVYFGSRGNVALEYQLPAASSWCDVVLLGAHEGRPAAVIVELKDWITRSDKPGRFEGLIERQGRQDLHPSDQVRGYAEYCRAFHSAVADRAAKVHGCVLFTNDRWASAYTAPPNDQLAREYPLFSDAPSDLQSAFPGFFSRRLTEVDEDFANAFAEGRYRQNRGFVAQIGAQILNPEAHVFELLDQQRKAFAMCRAAITNAFQHTTEVPPKRVLVIKGPPGSGKSVIAARLWASIVTDEDFPQGDVVFATTSMSQNSNWAGLFKRSTDVRGAAGVVRKATNYAPITTQRMGQLRRKYGVEFLEGASDWREHLQTLEALGETFRDGARTDQNLVSIVDEAHALINPEHVAGRGNFGFVSSLGPQAYHVIRSSLLSVFLLDPLQGFRQRENTTIDDIRTWAHAAGAGEPEIISLEGSQYRCAGSAEYVAWLEALLTNSPSNANREQAKSWQHSGETAGMDLRVFSDPDSMESALRSRQDVGASVRLLSSYSRAWRTKEAAQPHMLPAALQDFHEEYQVAGKTRRWSRIWNFVPRNGADYTWFVTGHPAGFIAQDPLCEVGCPYAVRGFDYDYVGILWLNDLLWRDGSWRVDPNAVEESGVADLTRAARREHATGQAGSAMEELLDRTKQAYRILLTRALKGAYLWIPDTETCEHVIASQLRGL